MQQQSVERRRRVAQFSNNNSSSSSTLASMPRSISFGDEAPTIDVYAAELDDEKPKQAAPSFWPSFSLPGVRAIQRPPSSSSLLVKNEDGPLIETRQDDGSSVGLTSDSSGSSFGAEEGGDVLEETAGPTNDATTTGKQPEQRPKRQPLRNLRATLKNKAKPLDIEEYAANREMTKCQEKWNAVTMVPPSLFCLVYLMSGAWISSDLMAETQAQYYADPVNFAPSPVTGGFAGTLNRWVGENQSAGCTGSSFMPAIPPLTLLAVAVGTCFHMPFSFIYHWKYAHRLNATTRVKHWSRRMDQSMIHFAAALFAYGSSGNVDYFLACAAFNLDCARRHFLPYFRPRSNQVRVGISIMAYALPILRRGDVGRFVLFWMIVGLSMWLFSKYPIGGWSHSAFHLVIGCLTPLLLIIASELPAAQPQLHLAAQCAVYQQHLA